MNDAAYPLQPSNQILSATVTISAIALVLYYLVPIAVPGIGFSPHVLAVIASFLLLLLQRLRGTHLQERIIFVVFLGSALLAILNAPMSPVARILHTWSISLMAFWVFRNTFHHLAQTGLDWGVQVLLMLWSLAAIAQVVFGEVAYVAKWSTWFHQVFMQVA